MSTKGPRRRGLAESVGQGSNRTRPGGSVEGVTNGVARIAEALRSQQPTRAPLRGGARIAFAEQQTSPEVSGTGYISDSYTFTFAPPDNRVWLALIEASAAIGGEEPFSYRATSFQSNGGAMDSAARPPDPTELNSGEFGVLLAYAYLGGPVGVQVAWRSPTGYEGEWSGSTAASCSFVLIDDSLPI